MLNGGVHINSGIPNRAFYLTAIGIGGFAWEAPGHIWYTSLKASSAKTDFQEFADTTYLQAGQIYGQQSSEQQAVLAAWKEVGIRISGVRALAGTATRMKKQAALPTGNGRDQDQEIMRRIDELSSQLATLTQEVASLGGGRPH